ncbi:MAG: bifunctional precorrin-2 dehydrogenase/sirohydrochlorin ferrochelatase [Thermodesulfobacteriota bacterium]
MSYLPINVDLTGRTCLVVGGGEVGRRKVESLLACGAAVTLVSRDLTPDLDRLVAEGQVERLGAEFESSHLNGAALVFAATDDPGLNARVSAEARSRGLWVNVADQPNLCTFIVPASVRRGNLTISVSTAGRSPALAARIRARIENEFGEEYGRFLEILGRLRPMIKAAGRSSDENKIVFQRLVDSGLPAALAGGDLDQTEAVLAEIVGPEMAKAALVSGPSPEKE